MVLYKILKRIDAASVFVAVVLALIVMQVLSQITNPLANLLSGGGGNEYFLQNLTIQTAYVQPLIWAGLQILLMKVTAWLYVGTRQLLRKKR